MSNVTSVISAASHLCAKESEEESKNRKLENINELVGFLLAASYVTSGAEEEKMLKRINVIDVLDWICGSFMNLHF